MKRLTMILLLLAPAFGQTVQKPSWCEKDTQQFQGPLSVNMPQSTLATCAATVNMRRTKALARAYPSSSQTLAFQSPQRDSYGTFDLFASTFSTHTMSGPASVTCAPNLPDCESSADPTPTTASVDTASVVPCNYYGVMHVGAGCAYYWGGGDIGAQWQRAYAALPASGGLIITNRQFGGYTFSTPFNASTPGKLVMLDLGGNIINYAPTTATTAITLNYGPTTGLSFIFNLGHGVRNGELTNHGCVLGLICGVSSAVGISLGSSAATGPSFDDLAIGGFSVGFETQGGIENMWGAVGTNIMLSSNKVGLQCNGLYESLQLFGLKAVANGTGILNAGGCDVYVHGGSLDANTLAVSNAAHTILDDMHIEMSIPFPGDTRIQHVVESSVGTVRILNSMLLDNNRTGNLDQWMSCADGSIDLSNDVFYSGRPATQVINATAPCTVVGSYQNDSPGTLLNFFGGNGFNNVHLAIDRNATSQITSLRYSAGDIFRYAANPDFAGPWGVTGISAGSSGPSEGFYFRFGSAGPVWQGDNGGGHIYAESAPGGTVWADITYAGMMVNGTLSLTSSSVACDSSHAGAFNYVAGGRGEKDTVQVCAKDANNAYAWRVIY